MDKILKQFGRDKIEETVNLSDSFVDVTSKLELPSHVRRNVERSIKRLDISVQHFSSIKRLKDSKNRYSKEKLTELVKKCKNYKEVLLELDILPITTNYNTLKKKLIEFDIDYSKFKENRAPRSNKKWDKENLESIIVNSKTQKEVLEKLGLRAAGGNFNTLRKYIKLYNIDISHFIKDHETMVSLKIKNKIPLSEILVENSSYNRGHLKERLYKEGLKQRICEKCGQDENWKGKKISLILDHINGVHNDNRIENLRIVCPNCNATLKTHCRKNVKKVKQ